METREGSEKNVEEQEKLENGNEDHKEMEKEQIGISEIK
jgi:hypothetical protein